MKDYAFYQGIPTIGGPRDAMKEAFRIGLIYNYDIWSDVINSRNQTSHIYDEELANKIFLR